MLVKDFMTSMIITADVEALVTDAAKLMAVESVGSLIVTRDDVLAGMVTRREIVAAQLLSEESYHTLTLGDIMETPVVTISPHAELGQALSLMNQTERSHIPVMEGDEITGVISASDVIRALATLKLLATGAEE
ncbi:MAG: cyclic nucleotide-binding/CBS domain-containing protein [Candidatus Thorarchaeota archaeon]